MTEQELDAIVESRLEEQLAARLEADRQRVRLEVISEIRREAERAHYDRINARHPIEDKYSGLGREGHEARLAAMRAGAARDAEHMARINSRPVEGSLLYNKQRASIVGTGGEGFAIKPVGQR
jgi:hypothetical protein